MKLSLIVLALLNTKKTSTLINLFTQKYPNKPIYSKKSQNL